MVGQMWSKWFLIFIVHVEKVLGDEYTLSRNKTDLGQSTIPCHINYNEDSTPHNGDSNSFTSYEVLISTHWMIHKGCYYFPRRDKILKQEHLEYNSPGRCSLFCESFPFFGLRSRKCICFKVENYMYYMSSYSICQHPCPNSRSNATCGSFEKSYVDFYNHNIEFAQNPEDQDQVDKTCLLAKQIDEARVKYKAVSCSEQHPVICFFLNGGIFDDGHNISKDQLQVRFDGQCRLFGDQSTVTKSTLPDNIFVWTAFIRSKVIIWKGRKQKSKMMYNNSKCQLLGNIQDGSTASLSIQSAEDTCFTTNLQCNLTIQPMCTVLDDEDIYEATTTSCEVQQSQITSIKQSTVMPSEVETQSEPNNAEWTSTYNSSSFGSVITLNGGSFLEYIVSTSVVFGILVLIYFAIWICKKVKEANKRKRNVSSPRNNVSHSQPCENVLSSVEYDEVNPNGMIDMTFPQVIDITVIEENNDSETRRNHSYVNQLAQHASISLHDLLPDDNEYEHPYHTLMDNRLSSQHEYSSANTKPEYENTKI